MGLLHAYGEHVWPGIFDDGALKLLALGRVEFGGGQTLHLAKLGFLLGTRPH